MKIVNTEEFNALMNEDAVLVDFFATWCEPCMKIVNTEEFNALMNEDAVLVDFFATWCGPCKMLTPVLESVANKLDGKVKIAKVDVDESPDLAQRFGIMSVPTMILFKKGQQAAAFSGYMPEAMLMQNIESKL